MARMVALRAQLNTWLDRSVEHRLTVSVAALALAFSVSVAALAFTGLGYVLTRHAEESSRAHAAGNAAALASQVSELVARVHGLASSPFVINGLSDSVGRDVYLAPLLAQDDLSRRFRAHLVVCDAYGIPIAATQRDAPVAVGCTPITESQARSTTSPASTRITRDHPPALVIEEQILFPPTQSYEGVLVARIDIPEIVRVSGTLSDPAFLGIASRDRLLFRNPRAAGDGNDFFDETATVHQPWMQEPVVLELRHRHQVERLGQPLLVLSLGFAGLVALLVLLAAGAARHVTRRQMAPLSALARFASNTASGERADLPELLRRPDEIGALAASVKAMGDALLAHGEKLEQQVAERTAELVEARDIAEAASRSKSEFFSRMSHELRTPLNAVLGFGQLLEFQGGLSPFQTTAVDEIRKAGQHLLALIDDLLDLAKIEAGKIALSLEPVELRPVLEECRDLLHPMASERTVAVEIESSTQAGAYVMADRTRLRQVVLNLLSNAIKYNRPGGHARLGFSTDAALIRVTVTDSGLGLGQEDIAQLFSPYSRIPSAGNVEQGTGIGLAITKSLVQLMSGTIGVDSERGHGSTFWFSLPHTPAPAAAAGALPSATGTPQALTSSPHRQRDVTIVYIEDNPANLRLVERILAGYPGVRLLPAHEPRLGLDLIRSHRPGLILLDINLPYMDGYEVLKLIRDNPDTRETPVVAISAYATKGDLARGAESGFAAYLTKPINVRNLLEVVERLLRSVPAGKP